MGEGARLRSRSVVLGAAFLGLAGTSLACGFGSAAPDDPVYLPSGSDYQQPGYTSGGAAPVPVVPAAGTYTDDDPYVFYCVDDADLIVDPIQCAADRALGDDWPYFLAFSTAFPRTLRVGDRLPSGGDRFNAADASSRSDWGLPSRITNGSTVRSGIIGGSGDGTSGS